MAMDSQNHSRRSVFKREARLKNSKQGEGKERLRRYFLGILKKKRP